MDGAVVAEEVDEGDVDGLNGQGILALCEGEEASEEYRRSSEVIGDG